MRLGMFRLQGVIARMLKSPMPRGAFYFFINKNHSLLKAVWFDGTGLFLFSKRLEQGTFSWLNSLLEEQRPKWQNCWAHVRRKFVETALDGDDTEWSAKMVEHLSARYSHREATKAKQCRAARNTAKA